MTRAPDKMKKTKTRDAAALFVIILILTAIYIFWGLQKSYIHMDEAYSFGLSNYDKVEIGDNEDFYDTWHDGEYYNDYLVVNEDESWDLSPVYNNQRDDVHPPLYYLLLRVSMEMSVGKFSVWPGIILNILIQAAATVLLLLVCKRLFDSAAASYAVTFLASLSTASLSSVMYIRMYALSGVFILLTLWLHLLLDERERIYRILPAIGAAAVCGSLTHYYYLFFLAALFLLFTVKLAREGRRRELASYIGTLCGAAAVSLAIFPYSIKHLFFGYRGQGAMDNLATPGGIINSVRLYIYKAEQLVFNHTLYIILGLILIFGVYGHIKKKLSHEKAAAARIVWIPTLFYFLMTAAASPYIELRYIMPISSLIVAAFAYFLYNSLRAAPKKVMCVILAAVSAAYLIIPTAAGDEPETVFSERRDIVEMIGGEYNLPALYWQSSISDRFLDDIYLFSLLDKSYIILDGECSEKTIASIFDGVDTSHGVIVFLNFGQEDYRILSTICSALGLSGFRDLSRLNECSVYYVGSEGL